MLTWNDLTSDVSLHNRVICVLQSWLPPLRLSYRGCDPPCRCWEPFPGRLQEQQALLTTEPCLKKPHSTFFLKVRVSFSLGQLFNHSVVVVDLEFLILLPSALKLWSARFISLFCIILKWEKVTLFYLLYIWVFCLWVCLYSTCVSVSRVQIKVSDPLELESKSYEPPCRCWELHPSPLKEQPVFWTTEPSVQPLESF